MKNKQRTVILPPSLTRGRTQGPKLKPVPQKVSAEDLVDQWERPKEAISPIWDNVKPEDIGSGFRPASQQSKQTLLKRSAALKAQRDMEAEQVMTASERAQAQAERIIDRKFKNNRHPFLNGNNRFIFYMIKVDVKAMAAEARAKREKPRRVNYANPISGHTRNKFAGRLKSNIDKTADFLWSEVLPITNSMMSAIQKVDDYSQQTMEEPSNVPAEYMKRKMMDAVHLRIVRHVADSFKLTKEERVLLTAEFRTKLINF